MTKVPTISVIVPAHNRANLLSRALTTIQGQTFDDFEAVVVDDASDDDAVRQAVMIDDVRFRYVRVERGGAAAARNRGVAASQAPFVTFLDSDDEVETDWLASLIAGFNDGASLVSCGSLRVDDRTGDRVACLPKPMGNAFGGMTALFACGGTFALTRELFDKVGGYTEGLGACQQHELALRVAPIVVEEHRVTSSIMRPLVTHHLHDGPRIRHDRAARLAGSAYVLTRHSATLRRDKRMYSNYCATAAVNAVRAGDYASARRYAANAWLARPANARAFFRLLLMGVAPVSRRLW